MATSDTTPEPDNGPDTTPGIPPSRPAPLAPPTPHRVSDTAFRPPERDGMSGLSIGLLAAVVVLGLYALVNWPWSRPSAVAGLPAVEAASAQTPAPAATAIPAAAGPASVAESLPAQTAEPSSSVHRCENASQVTYTDGPCPAGMRGQPVDTTTALSVEGTQGSPLYRCRGAGRFWSLVHCQHRGAEVVDMHMVPARLSLAEQIVHAQNREVLSRTSRPASSRAALGPPAPLKAAQWKASDCQRLDQLVAVLDDYARQPLPPREQDSVRRDRKKLRDEQFRLRCGR